MVARVIIINTYCCWETNRLIQNPVVSGASTQCATSPRPHSRPFIEYDVHAKCHESAKTVAVESDSSMSWRLLDAHSNNFHVAQNAEKQRSRRRRHLPQIATDVARSWRDAVLSNRRTSALKASLKHIDLCLNTHVVWWCPLYAALALESSAIRLYMTHELTARSWRLDVDATRFDVTRKFCRSYISQRFFGL